MPEWLMGADCKSAGYAYAGSNPARPSSTNGGVSEWFKVLVLKTSVTWVTVGSNPTPSDFQGAHEGVNKVSLETSEKKTRKASVVEW